MPFNGGDCGLDNVYTCDPRVKQFKEAEKAEKEAKKQAKLEAAKKEASQRKAVSVIPKKKLAVDLGLLCTGQHYPQTSL